MNEVLSQDEIDQLLTAISSGETEQEDFRPVNDTRKIKIYDFKRPDKFSKRTDSYGFNHARNLCSFDNDKPFRAAPQHGTCSRCFGRSAYL